MQKLISYSTSARDLFHPGEADDIFDYGPASTEEALCVEMSRLAYVRHEDNGGVPRLEKYLGRVSFTRGPLFNAKGTQGFVASGRSSANTPVTVIAFRGTEPEETEDVAYDALITPKAWTRGHVHEGFSNAFDPVRSAFVDAITNASGRLLITGHSLGAAIATLAASIVAEARRADMLLCTIGSPRVGDEQFAPSLAGVTHIRYAGACDAVTWLPPVLPFPRYQHHGALRCIDRNGKVHAFGSGEIAHDEATPLRGGCTQFSDILNLHKVMGGLVPLRQLTDHAPINYMSAVWGLRA